MAKLIGNSKDLTGQHHCTLQTSAKRDHLIVERFGLERPQSDPLRLPLRCAAKADQLFDDVAILCDQRCIFNDNNVGAVEIFGVVVTNVDAGAACLQRTAGILKDTTDYVGVGVDVRRGKVGAIEIAVVCRNLDDIV